jgi:hypothetical protein
MAAGKVLQIKRGTAASLVGVNLAAGELGFTTDTGLLYSSKAGSGNVLIGGQGVVMDTSDITLTHNLTLKGAPTTDLMAATKKYVDDAIIGLEAKPSVKYATVAAGTLSTSFANGQTVDGKTLATGDRILIKNQATGSENGIYVVNVSGAPTRAADMAAGSSAANIYVWVEDGNTLADTGWVCTNNSGSDVVGTASLAFVQFNGGAAYRASLGVKKSSNDFEADLDSAGGLELNTNSIRVKLDGSTLARSASGLKVASTGITATELAASVAGNGLTGGAGSALAVGAGTLMSVAADSVGLASGAADYQFIGTTTTPWTPAYRNISSLAGTGLSCTSGVLSFSLVDMDFGAFA